MRALFSLFLFGLVPLSPSLSQVSPDTTHTITISGEIQREIRVSTAELKTYPLVELGDVTITSHLGVVKKTMKGVKGVRAKDVLATLELRADSPKVWSEFYFVFTATDGYHVVFSWNELFNNPAGESVFFILERDGQPIDALDDSIALLATTDVQTGRRYVKGLKTIAVRRAD